MSKSDPHLGIIAVFPEPEVEASKYLAGEQVFVTRVLSLPLESVSAQGTPTMLLVGHDGTVENVWLGRLGKDTQDAALRTIGSKTSGKG
jgi:hypothetical protein